MCSYIFFFKQKTAYEMRISDWSSDVCSSDLDGASVHDASAISPDHAVTTEPLLLRGIEVLRGPSALLYGGSAIGGAINLLDDKVQIGRASCRERVCQYV